MKWVLSKCWNLFDLDFVGESSLTLVGVLSRMMNLLFALDFLSISMFRVNWLTNFCTSASVCWPPLIELSLPCLLCIVLIRDYDFFPELNIDGIIVFLRPPWFLTIAGIAQVVLSGWYLLKSASNFSAFVLICADSSLLKPSFLWWLTILFKLAKSFSWSG